jgi:hypothetical protein
MTPALLIRMSRRPNAASVSLDRALGLGLVGEVGDDDLRLAALGGDAPGQVAQAVLAAGGQGDLGAGLGQAQGHGLAEARRRAGDQGRAAVQIHAHEMLLAGAG